MGGKRKWDRMQREQLDFFAKNTFLAMGLIVMDVPNQARLSFSCRGYFLAC